MSHFDSSSDDLDIAGIGRFASKRIGHAVARYLHINRFDSSEHRRHDMRKLLAAVCATLLFSLIVGAGTVYAAEIEVDAAVGGTGCDLVDAISSANSDTAVSGCTAGSGDDVIFLNGIDQTFTDWNNNVLSFGPTATPIITSKIIIEGSGAVISRGPVILSFRLLGVESAGDLTLRNVTISNGKLVGGGSESPGWGAGVYNKGSLAVEDSTISSNEAQSGGGIYSSGQLDVLRSIVSDNVADYEGGGIANSGTASVRDSVIEENYNGGVPASSAEITASSEPSREDGGGIWNAGNLTIAHSTLAGNNASDEGGAIHNDIDSGGTVTLTQSLVTGNSADVGGGVYGGATSSTAIEQSTISGNHATFSGGGISSYGDLSVVESTINYDTAQNGAGVYLKDGTAHISNSTISGNTASVSGGGIGTDLDAILYLHNSTVTGNTAPSGGGLYNNTDEYAYVGSSVIGSNSATTVANSDVYGSVVSDGYNLVSIDSGAGFAQPGDIAGSVGSPVSADLEPLADNGGPTWTHAPMPGSPVLDAGSCTISGTITTDQRGRPRPFDDPSASNVDDGCDIGAYESQLVNIVKSVDAITAEVGQTLDYTVTIQNRASSAINLSSVTDNLLLSPFAFVDKNGAPVTVSGYSLQSGASITATANHEVTNSDIASAQQHTGYLINTATINASLTSPAKSLTDSDSAATLVLQPNLSIQKYVTPEVTIAGNVITYTVRYRNTGPGAASQVQIQDTLPLSTTLGGLVSADPALPPYSYQPGPPATVTWNLPSLAPTLDTAYGQIVYKVTVGIDAASSIANEVEITSATPFTPTYSTSARASLTVASGPSVWLSVLDSNKLEGNAGATAFTFKVERNFTDYDVTVGYAVTAIGAHPVNAQDFVGGALPIGTVAQTGNAKETTLTILVQGDNDIEANETFRLTLTSASGGTYIIGSPANGTIGNDDSAAVEIAKLTGTDIAYPGQQVSYTYYVTNTANAPLTIVAAVDDRLGAISLHPNTLNAGQIAVANLSYTVQESDLPGPIVNTVVVTATSGDVVVSDVATAMLYLTSGPVDTGSVVGRVTNSSGEAIVGATVTITSVSDQVAGSTIRQTTTDADGQYLFDGIAVGNYTVTASAMGFSTAVPVAVTVAKNQASLVQTIVLAPIEYTFEILLPRVNK